MLVWWMVCVYVSMVVCVYVNPVKGARHDEKSTGARQNSTVKSDSGYARCIKKKTTAHIFAKNSS